MSSLETAPAARRRAGSPGDVMAPKKQTSKRPPKNKAGKSARKPVTSPQAKRRREMELRRQQRLQRRRYLLWRLRGRIYVVLYWLVARLTAAAFFILRRLGPDRASNLGGWAARTFGPLLPVNRVGLTNLRHAFPEKSEAERRAILREVWDNLGRTAAEFVHLEALWDYDPDNPQPGRIEVSGTEQFVRLRDDGKPAIIFSAHLGNWELPAICAARYGLSAAAVYRAPNNPHIARRVEEIRAGSMGELLQAGSGQAVAFLMAAVLERGDHLGILVDQYLRRGLPLPFFGRIAHTNPTLGRLARQFECPVHGVRVIRLPGNRFRLELTEEIDLPRDADGRVDVTGTMKVVNSVVEGWVREYPGQWLWLHRRWR